MLDAETEELAIHIENGNFEWVKRLSEEEEKNLEEQKLREKAKKKSKSQRNASITNATTLT